MTKKVAIAPVESLIGEWTIVTINGGNSLSRPNEGTIEGTKRCSWSRTTIHFDYN